MDPKEELNNPQAQPVPPHLPKPDLPVLPLELLANKPAHSGKCPGKALLLMFLVALPISLVLGVAAHYLGIAAGFIGGVVAALPTLITGICGFVSWLFVIFGIVVVFGVFLGFPFLAGWANGALLVSGLGKKGLCRNLTAVGLAGALNGVFLYLGHALFAWLVSGYLHPITFTVERVENLFNNDIGSIPGLVMVVCGVELILMVVGGYSGARDELKNMTFCEEHQTWYGPWRQLRFPVALIESLAQGLVDKNAEEVEQLEPVTAETYPNLMVQSRCCPSADACDLELFSSLAWQETTVDKNGKATINNKAERWFDILLPSELGRAFETRLGLDKVVVGKKKKQK